MWSASAFSSLDVVHCTSGMGMCQWEMRNLFACFFLTMAAPWRKPFAMSRWGVVWRGSTRSMKTKSDQEQIIDVHRRG